MQDWQINRWRIYTMVHKITNKKTLLNCKGFHYQFLHFH